MLRASLLPPFTATSPSPMKVKLFPGLVKRDRALQTPIPHQGPLWKEQNDRKLRTIEIQTFSFSREANCWKGSSSQAFRNSKRGGNKCSDRQKGHQRDFNGNISHSLPASYTYQHKLCQPRMRWTGPPRTFPQTAIFALSQGHRKNRTFLMT